jgi:hypothetical protein
MSIPPFEPADDVIDPVRLLGESAVTAASLDAAGAPTPTVGIPLPVPVPDALPTFGAEEEFVPRFEPDTPGVPTAGPAPSAGLAVPEVPKAPLRVPVTGEQPRVSFTAASGLAAAAGSAAPSGLDALAPLPQLPPSSSAWAEVAGELPPREAAPGAGLPAQLGTGDTNRAPVVHVPASPGALTVASVPPGVPPAPLEPSDEKPRRRLAWLWIVLALLGGAAIAVLVYRLFFLPEPIILPAPVVTEAAPAPTIEPVVVTDASEFLAGMPTEIGTFVLTSYEVIEVIGDETLPARAAEHLVLTYGEATGEAHFTVNAYQFYNTGDAATAFDAWSEGASSTDDVTADGVAVGERALVTSGGSTSVVWSNGTAVFVLDGPADEVEQFYSYFGL